MVHSKDTGYTISKEQAARLITKLRESISVRMKHKAELENLVFVQGDTEREVYLRAIYVHLIEDVCALCLAMSDDQTAKDQELLFDVTKSLGALNIIKLAREEDLSMPIDVPIE